MIRSDNPLLHKYRKFILPLVLIAAFLLLYAFTGSAVHVDSHQYIAMHIRRDPVYPLFLFLLRNLFGDGEAYLYAAGFIQSVLNALAVYYFATSLTRLFGKKKWFLALMIFYACMPYVMTRFISVTKIQLASDILSESFTYPLFLCIFVFLLKLLTRTDKKTYRDSVVYISFLLILVITLIRGQVMALIVVWMLAVLYRVVRENLPYSQSHESLPKEGLATQKGERAGRLAAGILITAAAMVLFFAGRTALLKSYGLLIVGRYETHPNLDNFALSYVLYASDRADADRVPDVKIADIVEDDYGNELPDLTLRDLFLRMCDKMEAERWNMAYESGSFFERSDYMDACNDPIKFDVVEGTYVAYVKPYVPDYNLLDLVENDLSANMIRALLPEVIVPWLVVYARHVFFGFINSVGLAKPILLPVVLLIYAAAIFMTIAAFRKKKSVSAMAMLLCFVTIAGFATSISLMHFCIPRYMFYLFPCFYASLTALFADLCMRKQEIDRQV